MEPCSILRLFQTQIEAPCGLEAGVSCPPPPLRLGGPDSELPSVLKNVETGIRKCTSQAHYLMHHSVFFANSLLYFELNL